MFAAAPRPVAAAVLAVSLTLAGCKPSAQSDAVSIEQAKPVHRFDVLQAVAANGSTAVAVGAFGVVAVSSDGGVTWRRNELAGAPSLIKVASCGDGSFAALDMNGALWRAGADAGAWSRTPVPAKDALLDLTCTADNHLWVVGARTAILGSTDKGAHWSDKSRGEDAQLLNVQFTSSADGIITGEFGAVLVTQDGGANWAKAGSLGDSFYPQGMDFADSKHGIVVGLNGVELETADGGQHWVQHQVPTQAPLYGVHLGADGKALIVGAAGTAFSGSGDRWTKLEGLPLTDLRGLAVLTPGKAAAPRALVSGAGLLGPVPLSSDSL